MSSLKSYSGHLLLPALLFGASEKPAGLCPNEGSLNNVLNHCLRGSGVVVEVRDRVELPRVLLVNDLLDDVDGQLTSGVLVVAGTETVDRPLETDGGDPGLLVLLAPGELGPTPLNPLESNPKDL